MASLFRLRHSLALRRFFSNRRSFFSVSSFPSRDNPRLFPDSCSSILRGGDVGDAAVAKGGGMEAADVRGACMVA